MTQPGSILPSFTQWIAEVREEAWKRYLISEAEANALGIHDACDEWGSWYRGGMTPLQAVHEYLGPEPGDETGEKSSHV